MACADFELTESFFVGEEKGGGGGLEGRGGREGRMKKGKGNS